MSKKPNKKAAEKSTLILPEEIEYGFDLIKCVLDAKNYNCTIEINITYPQVKKILQQYLLTFQFDPSPWNDRIAMHQERITKILSEPELFEKVQNEKVELAEEDIKQEKKDRDLAEKNCPIFQLAASVNKIPNRTNPTKIIFTISKSKLNNINDKLAFFGNYKLKLIPLS